MIPLLAIFVAFLLGYCLGDTRGFKNGARAERQRWEPDPVRDFEPHVIIRDSKRDRRSDGTCKPHGELEENAYNTKCGICHTVIPILNFSEHIATHIDTAKSETHELRNGEWLELDHC